MEPRSFRAIYVDKQPCAQTAPNYYEFFEEERKVKIKYVLAMVCVTAAVNFASAETIRGINIDFVNIGHAGNAVDTQVSKWGTTGYGSVGYNYRIGKYEVTNAQWNDFAAVAGAPTGSDGGYDPSVYWTGAQQPSNAISWYEAAQFCNYLTSGNKSKGVYLFSGNNTNPGTFQGINRAAAISAYGTAYVIPTEDEWYKAAYYKPDGSGYSLYANGTNTAPVAGVNSNYNWAVNSPWNAGSGTQELNGTYDMMGNVWEWNEMLYLGSYRGIRGGAYYSSSSEGNLVSSYWSSIQPSYTNDGVGFRVASIPEPATLLLFGLGTVVMRKRRN